jgi:polyphenol oxidase
MTGNPGSGQGGVAADAVEIDGVLEAGNLGALRAAGIRHGFFGRRGGVSDGIYSALNCGFGSSDNAAKVQENRARVARHLGGARPEVVTLHQTHSAVALIVEGPFPRNALPQADAVVTRTPGLVIGALAADCCPVLLADPDAGVVAAAHAGWRGALTGVVEATLTAMATLGADRRRICAAVGPCINQAAYEVGPEFEAQFLAIAPGYAAHFIRASVMARPHFDLPGFVMMRLSRAGVGTIERAARCTYENESDFFSFRRTTHRREGDYGRQISAIMVT